MVQISHSGEIIKDLSNYTKIKLSYTIHVQGIKKNVATLLIAAKFCHTGIRYRVLFTVSNFVFLTALAHHFSKHKCIYISCQKWKAPSKFVLKSVRT